MVVLNVDLQIMHAVCSEHTPNVLAVASVGM